MGRDQSEQRELVCDQVELADLARKPEALARVRRGRRPTARRHLAVHEARKYWCHEPERALGAHPRHSRLRASVRRLVVAEVERRPPTEKERDPPRVKTIVLQLGL